MPAGQGEGIGVVPPILSVMPNVAPDSRLIYRLIPVFILGFHTGLQEEPILHCKVTFWPRYFQIGFALHRVR